MSNIFILDDFSFDNLEVTNNFNFTIQSISNVEFKKQLISANTIYIKNKELTAFLTNLFNVNITSSDKTPIVTKNDSIYIAHMTGKGVSMDCKCLLEKNNICFLKIDII